jgi:hypothetical protein
MKKISAKRAAQKAADAAFDRHLGTDSAATHVPECVIEAAKAAYVQSGGGGGIRVTGHGNRTHPVIDVVVHVDRRRTA